MTIRVVLTAYTDGTVRIRGGLLDQLEVLAWQKPDGRWLVRMDEAGHLHLDRLAGLILVRFSDIKARSPQMARRAAVTNSKNLPMALNHWQVHGCLPEPDNAWLGIVRVKDC